MKMCQKLLAGTMLTLCLSISLPFFVAAQPNYQPTKENLQAREWFQDAKFGLFIHWGVYSLMAGGGEKGIAEWIMHNKRIPVGAYEKLPPLFNPVAFDAKKWVQMAKQAGMKYITVTSKHHDGFAMYGSKVSPYNIVDRTPYGKDVLKMLAEECRKEGIRLFFYYSQLDWHHPDYFPRGNTGTFSERPESGNWDAYIDYMNAQLTELLTNYGEIGGIWFDGMWDKPGANWRLDETYALIHRLQPQALIGSNHHKIPFPGEDFQMFEKDLPGQNTAGFNTGEIGQLPLETCETINGSWGFNLIDRNNKDPKTLIRYIVAAAGRNSNFLLNVGPMPDGNIQADHIAILQEVGKWMEKNGQTIYGTRVGMIPPKSWGVSTQKNDNQLFLHLIADEVEKVLIIPEFSRKVRSVRSFASQEKIPFEQNKYGLIINLSNVALDPINHIIQVDMN